MVVKTAPGTTTMQGTFIQHRNSIPGILMSRASRVMGLLQRVSIGLSRCLTTFRATTAANHAAMFLEVDGKISARKREREREGELERLYRRPS
jgi:hypothetical protein